MELERQAKRLAAQIVELSQKELSDADLDVLVDRGRQIRSGKFHWRKGQATALSQARRQLPDYWQTVRFLYRHHSINQDRLDDEICKEISHICERGYAGSGR